MAQDDGRPDIKSMLEQGPDAAKARQAADQAGWYLHRARKNKRMFADIFLLKPAKRLIGMYRNDPWFRATLSLQFSTVINLFFAFYQGYNAYARHSFWFGALSAYYVLLVTLRFLIVNYLQTMAADGREELRRYRRCGIMLFFLSVIVILMGEAVNRFGNQPSYPGLMIFVNAAFTLYNIVFATFNLVKYRKLEDPLVSVSKAIPVVSALVSAYSLQIAMVGRFARESDSAFVSIISNATPIIVILAITGISGFIVVRSTWALNLFKDQD